MQGEAKPKTYNINYNRTSGGISTSMRVRRTVFPEDHGQHPLPTLIDDLISLDESDEQHKTFGQ
jgi:hypothetical protein